MVSVTVFRTKVQTGGTRCVKRQWLGHNVPPWGMWKCLRRSFSNPSGPRLPRAFPEQRGTVCGLASAQNCQSAHFCQAPSPETKDKGGTQPSTPPPPPHILALRSFYLCPVIHKIQLCKLMFSAKHKRCRSLPANPTDV